jgi:hypothetical protein
MAGNDNAGHTVSNIGLGAGTILLLIAASIIGVAISSTVSKVPEILGGAGIGIIGILTIVASRWLARFMENN